MLSDAVQVYQLIFCVAWTWLIGGNPERIGIALFVRTDECNTVCDQPLLPAARL